MFVNLTIIGLKSTTTRKKSLYCVTNFVLDIKHFLFDSNSTHTIVFNYPACCAIECSVLIFHQITDVQTRGSAKPKLGPLPEPKSVFIIKTMDCLDSLFSIKKTGEETHISNVKCTHLGELFTFCCFNT